MKAERLVMYRLYLFGMLWVTLQMILNTVADMQNEVYFPAMFARNWSYVLLAQGLLLITVMGLIITGKKSAITFDGIRLETLGKLAVIIVFFGFLMQYSHINFTNILPFIYGTSIVMLVCAVIILINKGSIMRFLLGMKLKDKVYSALQGTSAFNVFAAALLLLSVTDYVIQKLLGIFIPYHHNPSVTDNKYTYDIAIAITYTLAGGALYLYNKLLKPVAITTKSGWIKVLVYFCSIYIFILQFPVLAFQFIFNPADHSYTDAVYLLILAVPFVFHKISFNFKDPDNSEIWAIRAALVVFSCGYMVGSLCFHYVFNNKLHNAYMHIATGTVFIILSEPIARLLTGQRNTAGHAYGTSIKEMFSDKEEDED